MVRACALAVLGALLAAGCATPPRAPTAAARTLTGSWAFKDRMATPYAYDSADCGTDFGISYDPDGTFNAYEEEGRWSQSGDVVTETVEREIGEKGEMVPVTPQSRTLKLTWLSPNHVNTDGEDGASGMIRCPPGP